MQIVNLLDRDGTQVSPKVHIDSVFSPDNISLGSKITLTEGGVTVKGTLTANVSGNSETATKLATGRKITLSGDVSGSTTFDGSQNVTINTAVANDSHSHSISTVTGLQSALDGKLGATANAVSASKWANPRTITLSGDASGSVPIDGTGNVTLPVTVADNSHAHTIANVTGLQTALDGKLSTSGNAASASKLSTARSIALGGDVSGSASFDGSKNITITATVADDSHNHTIANVDGLQTALNGKLTTTGTAANSSQLQGTYNGSGGVIPPSSVGTYRGLLKMMYLQPESSGGGYCDWFLMNSYGWSDVPYCTAIGVSKTATPRAFIMSGPNSSDKSTWVRRELALKSDIPTGTGASISNNSTATRYLIGTNATSGNMSSALINTKVQVQGAGNLYADGFYVNSSRKYKENIVPTEIEARKVIEDTTVYDYNYKDDKKKIKKVGIIAEEAPDIISTEEKNGLDTGNAIGIIIKSLQELYQKIDLLERKIG